MNNPNMKIEIRKSVLKGNSKDGSHIDFQLNELPVNPICRDIQDSAMSVFIKYFLCYNWWSPQKATGFMHHSKPNTLTWKCIGVPRTIDGLTTSLMKFILLTVKFHIARKIEMLENGSISVATKEIKNLNKYEQMFSIAKHITLTLPFLNGSTLFDNKEKGFENKENGSLNQEYPILIWTEVFQNGKDKIFSHLINECPCISYFVIHQNDKSVWLTESNTIITLMLDYIWKTEEYFLIDF